SPRLTMPSLPASKGGWGAWRDNCGRTVGAAMTNFAAFREGAEATRSGHGKTAFVFAGGGSFGSIQVERACAPGSHRLLYRAPPPAAFAPSSRHLGRSSNAREEDGAWRRLIVEKPFGTPTMTLAFMQAEV